MVVNNIGKGWGKHKGVGDVFQGSGAGGTYFQVRDVGYYPRHGPGPGRFQNRVSRRITGRHP